MQTNWAGVNWSYRLMIEETADRLRERVIELHDEENGTLSMRGLINGAMNINDSWHSARQAGMFSEESMRQAWLGYKDDLLTLAAECIRLYEECKE
jgi:hypothetical protein